MRQILQSPRTGELELAVVPAPLAGPGQVLVRTVASVVSPGTETLAMEFAKSSLLAKARGRPDLVRQVARKLAQDGPVATWNAVVTRLEAPQPLGYSCAGVVEAEHAAAVRAQALDRELPDQPEADDGGDLAERRPREAQALERDRPHGRVGRVGE